MRPARGSTYAPVTIAAVCSSSQRWASTFRLKCRACSLPVSSRNRGRYVPSGRLAIDAIAHSCFIVVLQTIHFGQPPTWTLAPRTPVWPLGPPRSGFTGISQAGCGARGGRSRRRGSRQPVVTESSGGRVGGPPRRALLEVVAAAPPIPLAGEAVAGLAEERGLDPELFESVAGGGELDLDGVDLAVGVGQHGGRGLRAGGPIGASDAVVVLTAGIVQLAAGAVVRSLGGVSGGGKQCVLRMSRLRMLASQALEGGLNPCPVVELNRDGGDPTGVGRHVGQAGSPGIGPVGELLAGAGDGGPPQPEPAGALEDD